MKTATLYILLCATMLCYTGVTHAEASVEKVSKIDACIGTDFVTLETPEFTLVNYDMFPGFAMIQGDMFYEETISYCDFVEESIEEVYLEPDSPVPLIASNTATSPLK